MSDSAERLRQTTEIINYLTGLDLRESIYVTSYMGRSNLRRWVVLTPEQEWALLFDLSAQSKETFQSGGNALLLASSPLFALRMDVDFSLVVHADAFDEVRDAMKEYGIKDGEPYLTMSSVSVAQAANINTTTSFLDWKNVEAAITPIGARGSGLKLICNGEGAWNPE